MTSQEKRWEGEEGDSLLRALQKGGTESGRIIPVSRHRPSVDSEMFYGFQHFPTWQPVEES